MEHEYLKPKSTHPRSASRWVLPFTHPVDVVVDELVGVSGPGLEVLHHVPVVGAGVLVAVVAAPPVGRDAVHPERVAHPRVGALPLALLLVLVQTLKEKL